LSPGRAERHGFEYYRHGTLSLYAALNTRTGEIVGQTAARHTSAEFVSFLSEVVATQPKGREIHVILDNLSTHKTQQVQAFLALHPQVALHFTPTYSSWLNQVELWFSKIERDMIAAAPPCGYRSDWRGCDQAGLRSWLMSRLGGWEVERLLNRPPKDGLLGPVLDDFVFRRLHDGPLPHRPDCAPHPSDQGCRRNRGRHYVMTSRTLSLSSTVVGRSSPRSAPLLQA
jgi:transposase